MRTLLLTIVVVVVAAAAFALGRLTAPNETAKGEEGHSFVVRLGDQIRVPDIDLFCTSDFEIDRARLLCNRLAEGARHQVVFEKDRTSIGRLGYPGEQQVFPEEP